jgi:hydrogenase maturation factor
MVEKLEECQRKADKYLSTAQYMIAVTYPMVSDARMLITILDNVFLALTNAMGAILYSERMLKTIPPFHDTFDSKYMVFTEEASHRLAEKDTTLALLQEVKELILAHKQSPVEFTKEGKYVICSDTYAMKTIDAEQIKNYISKTSLFCQESQKIVEENKKKTTQRQNV